MEKEYGMGYDTTRTRERNRTMQKKRLVSLDILRILAMLLIFVFHFAERAASLRPDGRSFLPLKIGALTLGDLGVSIFFLLSGVSLMYVYEKKLRWGEYLKKRFLSIYPGFWIAYLIAFSYYYVWHRLPMVYPKTRFLLSFTAMDGFLRPVLPNYYLVGEWFVGAIVLIYLIFPLLRQLVLKKPLLTLAGTVLLYPLYLHFYALPIREETFFLTRIPEILLGMYYMAYLRNPASRIGILAERYGGLLHLRRILGLISFPLLLIFLFVPNPLPRAIQIPLCGAAFFLSFQAVFEERRYGERFSKLSSLLSSYTYAIFLVHHVLLIEVQNRNQKGLLSLPSYFLLLIFTLALSVLLGVFIFYVSKFVSKLFTKKHPGKSHRQQIGDGLQPEDPVFSKDCGKQE